jgi:hypothetical protein
LKEKYKHCKLFYVNIITRDDSIIFRLKKIGFSLELLDREMRVEPIKFENKK